jgi:hypothetical protein
LLAITSSEPVPGPAGANGVRAVQVVLDEQVTSTASFAEPVSGSVPNEKDIAPEAVEKPEPVIVTLVPP